MCSSVHPMNNSHQHHHNYLDNNSNRTYSIAPQLSETNVNITNDSSAIVDYYGQHSYHPTTSRSMSHYPHNIYQENVNHLYPYNLNSSSSTTTNNLTQKYFIFL